MDIKIVTNNDEVLKNYDNTLFVEGDFKDVLLKTRDLVHRGYKLVSHPLPASIRMIFSSIRSVIVENSDEFDEFSIDIIEKSIEKYEMTMKNRKVDYRNEKDYKYVDHSLLKSSLIEVESLMLDK